MFRTDDEASELWKTETDIAPNRIIRCDEKDNFWEMGNTGPCGPCSEIHMDLGPQACDNTSQHICEVNGNCNRYVELWNLVFIQYNRKPSGDMEPLPAQHVDTGAGLERIAGILQKTYSNYETDLFIPIIKKIEELSNVPYKTNKKGMPHRVMADHIRTLVFAISDNVMPSNEGRGYVLRRLLRRALRYAKQIGLNQPSLHLLVETVSQLMGPFYENIPQRETFIKQVILEEEKSFLVTLDSGILRFEIGRAHV